ncbi:MAG: hypothetical protein NVSMB17_19940 [Candidatus Dormibacteria bacterium]
MVVEFMPNGSLQERMPATAVPASEAIALLRPLGEALDYAHSQGVLHRDVKPANVFLDSGLLPVLADFGLAKMYGDQSITATGMISGTPTHISPEQTMGYTLTNASDLYSLAVIGFQLLTGRLPFIGEGMMDLLYAQVNADVPLPSTINPQLAPQVDEVMLRALAKDPTRRWASAAEMVSALEAAAAGRPDERRPAGLSMPSGVAPKAGADRPGAAAQESPTTPLVLRPVGTTTGTAAKGSRRRWYGAAAALTLVALAGALVALAGPRLSPTGIGPTSSPDGPPETAAPPSPTALKSLIFRPPGALRRGEVVYVTGRGLDPRYEAGVGVLQRDAVRPISAARIKVASDGSFKSDGIVPLDLVAGPATLVACSFVDSRQATDLTKCVQTNVTIAG